MLEGSGRISHICGQLEKEKILGRGVEAWQGSMSGMFKEWGGGPCSCWGASKGKEKWEVRSERPVSYREGECHVGPPTSF